MQLGQRRRAVALEVTWGSILRVAIGVLLAWAVIKLWPFFKLLLVAILIAVALYPLVGWVCSKGWPRWLGLLLASGLLLLIVLGGSGLIAPILFRQVGTLVENLPKLQKQVVEKLPSSGPIHDAVQQLTKSGSGPNAGGLLKQGANLGKMTMRGLFDLGLLLVLAIYLMVDGPRTVRWLMVFFPVAERPKIAAAFSEGADLVFAYVVGQFITSALCAVYVFLVLLFLHVPMALLLGVIAGIFDVLPIIGFFLSVIPAMVVGLTVSVRTALLILVLYGAYHLIENYFIVPKVYGNRLKLSTLAVLLSITVAGLLAGVVGAIVILPLVAAYPVLERLWLAPKLQPDTALAHQVQNSE